MKLEPNSDVKTVLHRETHITSFHIVSTFDVASTISPYFLKTTSLNFTPPT